MTSTELLDLVMRSVPYPSQVQNIDTTLEPGVLRFTWRGRRFRVEMLSRGVGVEEVQGRCLAGSDIAILMQEVLRRGDAMQAETSTTDEPALAGKPPGLGLRCPRCAEDTKELTIDLNLNALGCVYCPECDTYFNVSEHAWIMARQAARWKAAAQWIDKARAWIEAAEAEAE